MSESLKSRFYSFRNQYRELLRSDPRIRNRLLAILILLGLLSILIVFNIQQGFAGFEEGQSRLILFIAVNINIVLLAIVFYLIARNLLKLVYERKQHVLGVNLKTKLIISFIILSLPAMGFHLFASIFIANLQKGDWRQLLPGACRGARDDRIIFDAIADMLIAPLLGERMRQTVMRSSLKDIAASMRGGHF